MVEHLQTIRIPDENPIRKEPPQGVIVLSDGFWKGYDTKTIIYDVIKTQNGLTIFTPPLINLEENFTYSLKEQFKNFKIKKCRYFNKIKIKINQQNTPHELILFNQNYKLRASVENHSEFNDLNVLYAQNKNNKIEWIKDWLHYHNIAHHANGALIVDNGSNEYTAQELEHELKKNKAYSKVVVVSAPLPFMPISNTHKGPTDCNFFQPAMHNIMYERYLKKARGVLSLDIDEMLVSKSDKSIFNSLNSSPIGAITFSGHWVYCKINDEISYRNHIYRSMSDKDHRGKYAYKPKSFMGRGIKTVHVISKGIRNSLCQRILRSDDFLFLHYRSISTSWASDRSPKSIENLTICKFSLKTRKWLG